MVGTLCNLLAIYRYFQPHKNRPLAHQKSALYCVCVAALFCSRRLWPTNNFFLGRENQRSSPASCTSVHEPTSHLPLFGLLPTLRVASWVARSRNCCTLCFVYITPPDPRALPCRFIQTMTNVNGLSMVSYHTRGMWDTRRRWKHPHYREHRPSKSPRYRRIRLDRSRRARHTLKRERDRERERERERRQCQTKEGEVNQRVLNI